MLGIWLAVIGASALAYGLLNVNREPERFAATCTPVAPTITSIVTSPGVVFISWTGVLCARAYAVHRNDGQVGSVTATQYADHNVTPGRSLSYTVAGIAPDTLVREGPPSGGVSVVTE